MTDLLEVAPPPKLGRPFEPQLEAALMPLTRLLAAGRTRHASQAIVIPEFSGPFGVPDLAVLVTTRDALEQRERASIPPLTGQADAAVAGLLSARRPRTSRLLARELGGTEADVYRVLERLEAIGAVMRSRRGYTRHLALTPLGRLHVYEVKVSDWRRGLHQAATYAAWADQSTLVLGRRPGSVAVAVEEARRHRVGLTVGKQWYFRPRLALPRRPLRLWASEIAFAAFAAGNQSPSPRA